MTLTTHQMTALTNLIADPDGWIKDDHSAHLHKVMAQLVEDGMADTDPIRGGWVMRGERKFGEKRIARLSDGTVVDLSEGETP